MADSEAIKRAYAEILLNTTQESAMRVLVSERRAVAMAGAAAKAKEDGVAALVRLKSIMEAKIEETEQKSFGHVRKIQELENELQEALETISHLRTELQRITGELKNTKINVLPPSQVDADDLVDSEGKKSSETSNSDSKLQISIGSSTSAPESSNVLKQPGADEPSYLYDALTEVKSQGKPQGYLHSRSRDLPSFLKRNKELELFRNGCTHRIRALEKNCEVIDLPLSQKDQQNFDLQTFVAANSSKGTPKKRRSAYAVVAEVLQDKYLTASDQHTETAAKSSNSELSSPLDADKGAAVRDWPEAKFLKRRRNQRCKSACTDDIESTTTSMENFLEFCKTKRMLKKKSKMITPDCSNCSQSPQEILDIHFKEDPEVLQFSQVTDLKPSAAEQRESNLQPEKTTFPEMISHELRTSGSLTRLETDNNDQINVLPLNHQPVDEDTAEPDNAKHIKYTFSRRKRKAESLERNYESGMFEKSIFDDALVEKDKGPHVPNPLESPCRDSRMVQVAQQLISLSANQW